jgi:hypothetical protein
MTSSDSKVSKVVVVGSKPNSSFPEIGADVVVTAKSAVIQGLVYREKYGTKVISLVPWPELITRDYVGEALVKAQPEELVILGDNDAKSLNYIHKVLKLKNTKVKTISCKDRNYGLLIGVGVKVLRLMLYTIWNKGLRFFYSGAFMDKDMIWLHRSAGINAILYSLKRFPNAKEIVVVGIGLEPGDHFDGKGDFTKKSAKHDQVFMKFWPKKKRPRVYTTDNVLSEKGDVPKWDGSVFSQKIE